MNPESFHDLLDRATLDAPPAPPASAATAEGHRRLRRRRAGVLGGALAAVVLVGGATYAVRAGDSLVRDSSPPVADRPSTAPTGDAALLEACRTGAQGKAATERIFGSGTPTVEASSRTDHQVILAIQSADGQSWANCFVHLDHQEFDAGMTVYDGTGTSTDLGWSTGGGCGLVDGDVDAACRTWELSYVDRLPAPVAAVRFDIGDGTPTTVPTRDGFVVLNLLRELPDGGTLDPMGDLPDEAALTRVTYLDAAGGVLAAQAMDGTGSGPDGEVVDGLPLLKAYPSLRSDTVDY